MFNSKLTPWTESPEFLLTGCNNKAIRELKSLFQQHPKWFHTFQENLLKWIEQATPIDWSKLETQDPFGRLRKLNFERTIKSILQGKST